MSDFMILLRGDLNEWESLSPDQSQKILNQYKAWVDQLKQQKIFKAGSPLKNGHWKIHQDNSTVQVDGPFTETKETLTGYFIIEAKNPETALDIAKNCPALTHGEFVEVFELGH